MIIIVNCLCVFSSYMIGSKGDSGYQFLLMIFLSIENIENISQAGWFSNAFIFEHFIKNS